MTKYEPEPLDASQNVALFPEWIVKTDEERIQTRPELIEPAFVLENTPYLATEKLDGCSATYYLNLRDARHPFGVCSRGQEILTADNTVYWRMAAERNLPEVLKRLAERHQVSQVVLQGEIVGEGVQKNKYKLKGLELYCFNLLLDGRKHTTAEIKELLDGTGINTVPVAAGNFVIPGEMPEMVKLAEGQSLVNPQTQREGIVVRSLNHRVSFKVINPQFLLKYDA